jgi:hypothetical protein
MGTGFTIDSALEVAKYGISTVLSLVDDNLIERMREHHSSILGAPFEPIGPKEPDARARRITAYLNLIERAVADQVEDLSARPFGPASEITRYFELLPPGPLRDEYQAMLEERDPLRCRRRQDALRKQIRAGSIDVNIMTKIDRRTHADGSERPSEDSDALSALRGFAKSEGRGAMVFSAGLNPRLYGYCASFDEFFPDRAGTTKKRIILKVSDYRSAAIQGRFFAKRGLWVSEYRVESGVNCGGHAFPTGGQLLGAVLQEFSEQRSELVERLFTDYQAALEKLGRTVPDAAPSVRLTVQGGIGTAAEAQFLRDRYGADATGWGSPFLLVPSVTRVDAKTRQRLLAATPDDIRMSDSSPLLVPFWNLMTSSSEERRRRRLSEGRPGSQCPQGFLATSTEFGPTPLCPASRGFQRRAVSSCSERGDTLPSSILAKSCICVDLAGGALIATGVDPKATSAICPGPNLLNFKRIATLEEMVGQIYGRSDLIARPDRAHVFVAEARLYVDYYRDEAAKVGPGALAATLKRLEKLRTKILEGIAHYREIADEIPTVEPRQFLEDLAQLEEQLVPLEPDAEQGDAQTTSVESRASA